MVKMSKKEKNIATTYAKQEERETSRISDECQTRKELFLRIRKMKGREKKAKSRREGKRREYIHKRIEAGGGRCGRWGEWNGLLSRNVF